MKDGCYLYQPCFQREIMLVNNIQTYIMPKSCQNKQISVLTRTYDTNPLSCDTFTPSVSFKAKIHDCAKNGDLEGLKRELAKGVDINLRDEDNRTALILATNRGFYDIVRELLSHPDIDVNARSGSYASDQKNTALILASLHDFIDIAKELLKHPGIDINIEDEHDKTAYHYANSIIKQMIKDYVPGVDRRHLNKLPENVPQQNTEKRENSTIYTIPDNKQLEIILSSTDPLVKTLGFDNLIKFIDSDQFNPNCKDDIGRNVIQLSMLGRDERIKTIISKALSKGVDINAQNNFGQTALMTAIKNFITAEDNEEKMVDLSVIKFILEQNPDIDIQDKNKQSAFHLACMSTSVALLTLILSKDPHILLRDVKGKIGANYFKTNEIKELYQKYTMGLALK